MSLTTEQITNFILSLVVNPQVITPLSDTIPVVLKPTFSDISNLRTFTGTFTANNNSLDLFAGIPQDQAPNFILIIASGQINVGIFSSSPSQAYPYIYMVSQNYSLYIAPTNLDPYIKHMFIDGSAGVDNPMPQNVPVDYTIITATVTVTPG